MITNNVKVKTSLAKDMQEIRKPEPVAETSIASADSHGDSLTISHIRAIQGHVQRMQDLWLELFELVKEHGGER